MLAGAVLVGVVIRLAYVLITSGHTPVNDELEYHREGIFIAHGVALVDLAVGIPHESLVKPPTIPSTRGPGARARRGTARSGHLR